MRNDLNLPEPRASDGSSPNIGLRLRHARLTKRLSLKELAAAAGCSEGFLSKVENDKVKPSLSMLHRLVGVLNTNITTLFAAADPQDDVFVTRRTSRSSDTSVRAQMGHGVSLEALSPIAHRTLLQAGIHVIEAHGRSDGTISHRGEEIGFVLEGTIELIVSGKSYILEEGDSFFFASKLDHEYRNPGRTRTKVLWINTPPTF
ncbi:cupin domain-containing protein [Nitratireductor sp. StC3]|uniref:cupin domain-containing protein n=1 Tax=Nitratireductor sp. StC3 TaxID=2126741 RepID=UPI0024780936|nr:cupin domain-containing protein [Nitratireductor sp. StC3]